MRERHKDAIIDICAMLFGIVYSNIAIRLLMDGHIIGSIAMFLVLLLAIIILLFFAIKED